LPRVEFGGMRDRIRVAAYWIVTLAVAQENLAGAIWAYLHLEFITANLKHLGYPPYFLNIIGFWQLLCALAILIPRFGRVKEWAYAGAFFNYTSAVFSHMMVGDGPRKWAPPLVYSVLAVVSWALRPLDRRVAETGDSGTPARRGWIASVVALVLIGIISLL